MQKVDFNSELKGLMYTRLTLTGNFYLKKFSKQSKMVVEAKCECGKIKYYVYDVVKRQKTKSCGCLTKDVAAAKSTTHGLSKHPLYKVWIRLREKCNDLESKASKNYGRKGVQLCDIWEKSYTEFYKWATENGWHKGLQIDKDKLYIKKHGGKTGFMYSPEYCCFLTQKENKKFTSRTHYLNYKGEIKTITEWANIFGVARCIISNRLRNNNGDIEKTLSTPFLKRNRKKEQLLP